MSATTFVTTRDDPRMATRITASRPSGAEIDYLVSDFVWAQLVDPSGVLVLISDGLETLLDRAEARAGPR